MKLVTINLPEKHLDIIHRFLEQGRFPSRSEAIRYAVREFINSELQIEKKEEEFLKHQEEDQEGQKGSHLKALKNKEPNDFFKPSSHYYKEAAEPVFERLNQSFHLPPLAQTFAWKIYAETVQKNISPKKSVEILVSASYYISSRIIKHTILVSDLSELLLLREHRLRSTILLLITKVLVPLEIEIEAVTEREIAFKYCKDVRLPKSVAEKAIELLDTIRKANKDFGKERDKSYIAAALYITSQAVGETRSQAEIANLPRISTVTLRDRISKIKKEQGFKANASEIFKKKASSQDSELEQFYKAIIRHAPSREQDVMEKDELTKIFAKFDELVAKGTYNSRREALKAALKEFLESE